MMSRFERAIILYKIEITIGTLGCNPPPAEILNIPHLSKSRWPIYRTSIKPVNSKHSPKKFNHSFSLIKSAP